MTACASAGTIVSPMGFCTCRATGTTVSPDDETSAAGIAKPTSQAQPDAIGHRRRQRQLAAVERQLVQRQQRAQRRQQLVDAAEQRRIARRPHQHKHQAGDSRAPRAPLLRRRGLLNGDQKKRSSASWQQRCARDIQQANLRTCRVHGIASRKCHPASTPTSCTTPSGRASFPLQKRPTACPTCPTSQ